MVVIRCKWCDSVNVKVAYLEVTHNIDGFIKTIRVDREPHHFLCNNCNCAFDFGDAKYSRLEYDTSVSLIH